MGAEITISSFEASGYAWADVYDGDGAQMMSGSLTGPEHRGIAISAVDLTPTIGSYGASAGATGTVNIYDLTAQSWGAPGLRAIIHLDTSYRPSAFHGGENPGGAAEGQLSSLIEFRLPVEQLYWSYQLRIRDTLVFDGETVVAFENISQGQILNILEQETPFTETTLNGEIGDLIRITSYMSGYGQTGPNGQRQYTTTLDTFFLLPEPSTLLMAVVLAGMGRQVRRWRSIENG